MKFSWQPRAACVVTSPAPRRHRVRRAVGDSQLILKMVGGTKPKNELQAALASQMVAVTYTGESEIECEPHAKDGDAPIAALLGNHATPPPCLSPALKGKRVCRMHGGVRPEPPQGAANGAWKHGVWTKRAIAIAEPAGALLGAFPAE